MFFNWLKVMIIVVEDVKFDMMGIEIKLIMNFKWRNFIVSRIILLSKVNVIV